MSNIYHSRHITYPVIEKNLDFGFVNLEETSRAKKGIFKMMTIDIINTEKRLQSTIEEFIEN